MISAVKFAFLLALGLGVLASGDRSKAAAVAVAPLKPGGVYGLREPAGWTVSGAGGTYHYEIKRNNAEVIKSGDVDLSQGPAKIEISLGEPAMLTMILSSSESHARAYGAAVAPTMLRPVAPRPADFDSFWRAKIALLHTIPENPLLDIGDSYNPDVDYWTIRMDHIKGTHVYGQIAKPKKPGKYPAIALFQWASPPYPLEKSWVIDLASEGFIVLNIEPHDVLPDQPKSYYDALSPALKNYQSIGQENRDESYFVEMYLRDYRAVDYLSHLPDWDGKTLVVMGTSMGGQQSLCVAGLHPKVTHVIVNEPAGCDLNAALHGRQEGYPFFPANNPKVMETARYVDAVNFAPNIRATCLVAMGFVDVLAPPAGIWTAFNLIRGPKEAAPMFDSPHNNTATPEEQRPYTDRSAEWLTRLAHREKVDIRK
jgi:cephalosporin-C deacetylase-like acetyl esterase